MAIHSRILTWRIPWTEEPVGYSPWGCRVGHDWAINTFASFLLYWKADAFIFFNTYLGKQCKPRQHIKKQLNHFANKGPSSQSDGFSSSHVQMWELNHEEGWVLKNWCFQTIVCEKTIESLLDSKEIKPVNSKENQPWIFIGRTDAEAEALILWLPDAKSWLIRRDPDPGKDWGQEE